jgi:tetratricopeptide (TPR) repeat protein
MCRWFTCTLFLGKALWLRAQASVRSIRQNLNEIEVPPTQGIRGGRSGSERARFSFSATAFSVISSLILTSTSPTALAGLSPQSVPMISLMGHVQDARGRPVPHVEVIVATFGTCDTSDTGDFQLKFPESSRTYPIKLSVSNWVVMKPNQGERGQFFAESSSVPGSPIRLTIIVAKKGDPELLSKAQLQQEILRMLKATNESRPLDHDDFIASEAKELGTTEDQLRLAVTDWLQHVQGPYETGMAASYNGEFERARTLLAQSISPTEKDLVDKYIQLANVDHLSAHFEEGVEILNKALVLQPNNAAALEALGHLYMHLQRPDLGLDPLVRALTIRNIEDGPNSVKAANTAGELGEVYSDLNRYNDADPLLRHALEVDRRALAPDSLDVAMDKYNLAEALVRENADEVSTIQESRYDEAGSLYTECIASLRRGGVNTREYLSKGLLGAGRLATTQKNYPRADDLLGEALETAKASEGSDGLNVSSANDDLATLRIMQHRLPEAESFQKEAVRIRKTLFGDSDLNYASTVEGLADVYWAEGKYEDARKCYSEVVQIRTAKLGKTYTRYSYDNFNLAQAWEREGHYGEAMESAKIALAADQQRNAPLEEFAQDYIALARIANEQSKFEESDGFVAEALAKLGDYQDADAMVPAALYCLRGQSKLELKKYDEAEEWLNKSIKMFPQSPSGIASARNCTDFLADTYYDEKRYAQAELTYADIVGMLGSSQAKATPDFARFLNNLGKTQLLEKKYADAESNCGRAVEMGRAVLPKDSTELAWYIGNLAAVKVTLKKFGEAEKLYSEALEIDNKMLPVGHPQRVSLTHGLAQAVAGANQKN